MADVRECDYCEDDEDEACLIQAPSGLACTREAGHSGEHVACGTSTHLIERWKRNPES